MGTYVRGAYQYDVDSASMEAAIDQSGELSMTQQQFAEDADINTIVRRFGLTGQLPENLNMPQSGDFEYATTFHESMNVVRRAQEEFMRVPAETRARFNNDPARLIAFIEDGRNRDEAIRLGLVPKPPEVVPGVVTPPPAE